jgi:uncharacterized protein (DUF1330 family)
MEASSFPDGGHGSALRILRRNDVKKFYSVIVYRSVLDAAALAEYARLATPLIDKFGGKVIARGNPLIVFEDAVNERVTVLEWDHPDHAVAMYRSEAYQAALAHLDGKVVRDNRIVEGI